MRTAWRVGAADLQPVDRGTTIDRADLRLGGSATPIVAVYAEHDRACGRLPRPPCPAPVRRYSRAWLATAISMLPDFERFDHHLELLRPLPISNAAPTDPGREGLRQHLDQASRRAESNHRFSAATTPAPFIGTLMTDAAAAAAASTNTELPHSFLLACSNRWPNHKRGST